MMGECPVPVSMWSPRFVAREVESCLVSLVWFPPDAVLHPHVHDRPTLAVVLTGGFDLAFTGAAVRRSRLACPAGTILTQPAGEKHTNYIGAGGAYGVVLQPAAGATSLPDGCDVALGRVNHFRDGPIFGAASRVAREIVAPDGLSALAVEGSALEMLAGATQLDRDVGRTRNPPSWLRRTTELVHERFRENLRIEQIAEDVGVHSAHLAVVFRRVHRMPLASYMRHLRVQWAADRLVQTDVPISAIAASAGFADQAHLTRWFRRVIGSTPAAYRNSHRH